jgi:N-acetylneuraminate synthase
MSVVLVGEVGINGNGSLDIVKMLIDKAVQAKLDYVKFQKRDIPSVYSKEELDKYRESPWGTTNREQKYGLEFNREQYNEIDRYCKLKGIGWFASPWDVDSVDFLMEYKPDYIKVASAKMTNMVLLKKIKDSIEGTNTKVIVATGMTTLEELTMTMEVLGYDNVKYILACTSSYPTPTEDMNMNKIITLQNLQWPAKIGFSNHYNGLKFINMAAVMGCEMIEFHITLDRTMYGSDQAASIESSGFSQIRDYIDEIEIARGDGKLKVEQSEINIKKKLRNF